MMTEKRPTLSIKRKPTNPIAKVQSKGPSTAAGKPATTSKLPKTPEAAGKAAKLLTEAPVASEQPPLSKAERIARNRAKKIRQGEAALPLLILLWPSVFSLTAPKPLKIGIKEDVIAYAAERGLELNKAQISAALMVYINRVEYRLAVAQGGQRVDLHGLPAGEVDEKSVEHAKHKLEKQQREVIDG